MKARSFAGNLLWALSCLPARLRQARAMLDPAAAQRRVLTRLLHEHATSEFGREHGFHELRDAQEFQQRVPVSDYETLRPRMERAMAGEGDVLACGAIRAFELTSGSTSAAKHIPCTAASLAEIHEAVRAWMGDLFLHHPALLGGPSWWIVSALQPSAPTYAGIPVGLASDLDYLSVWERLLARWILVQTPALRDLDTSLDEVAAVLASEHELRLISVWNPSLLVMLRERAGAAWPKLHVISAWADAWAATDAQKVRELFPGVIFQPKGLLATEGVVTIPWGTGAGAVPALNSHFLEFLDAQGGVHLVHELKDGGEYEVLISTGAGLWRYRLGDLVRVVGREENTPRLQFIGRADGVCDLRGEKLHPQFVAELLKPWQHAFAMLAPLSSHDGYGVFADTDLPAAEIETRLCTNPHYAHCRRLGQLQAVRVFRVRGDAAAAYLARCVQLGQRASTVKNSALHPQTGWEGWFDLI